MSFESVSYNTKTMSLQSHSVRLFEQKIRLLYTGRHPNGRCNYHLNRHLRTHFVGVQVRPYGYESRNRDL